MMKSEGISVVFHYIPLHSSPAGKKLSPNVPALPVTDFVSDNIVRLPLYIGLDVGFVIDKVDKILSLLFKA